MYEKDYRDYATPDDAADTPLQRAQLKLAEIGLLDPPADGIMGPLTRWAIEQATGDAMDGDVSLSEAQLAKILAAPLLPLDLSGESFPVRVLKAWQARGAWIARHPDCFNIGYVEACDPDGTPNADIPNNFDATRIVIQMHGGVPVLVGSWEATTTASAYWTQHPMQEGGAARIALGQQKAWTAGKYEGHSAWKQTRNLLIHRDPEKTYKRYGPTQSGMFGIHHHHGYNYPRNNEGRSSAGCQVGRLNAGHDAFMALTMTDARYHLTHSYAIFSTVIHSSELAVSPTPTPAPDTQGWNLNIKATNFGGPKDNPFPMPSAYGGNVDWNNPTYALPYRFPGHPPLIELRQAGVTPAPIILVKGGDVGPWYNGRSGWPYDKYWETGSRPRAESDARTNRAGIDLTPGVWRALGLNPNTGGAVVHWRFKT